MKDYYDEIELFNGIPREKKNTRLRRLRENYDLTQTELSEILGCHQTTYSSYEHNRKLIPTTVLCKLADIYSTTVDYLLYRTDERYVKEGFLRNEYWRMSPMRNIMEDEQT